MATPVLNNGIFLRDTSYKASSHVDSYHLTQMLGNSEPMGKVIRINMRTRFVACIT